MRVSGAVAILMAATTIAGGGLIAQTPPSGTTVKDGVDAWQRNNYTEAVAIWRPLAQKGDADAAFDMAQAYKLGRGVPTDLAQAKTLYGVAARGGHLQGAANYGLLLFQDGDRAAAIPWIRKASDAGDPRAQYVYGTALFNGDLAPKDWPKAYALMTRAAAAGLPQATTSLAQMDQYLTPADRQKGLAMASALAAQPMPPLNRQVTVAAEGLPPQLPPAPAPVRSVDIAASRPAPRAPLPVVAPARPPKPPRPVPVASAAARGGWQVQLGAYSSESAAASAWSQLSGKASGLRGLSPSYVRAGAVVRLRAGGLADRAAAAGACAAAKQAGAACFPVAP
ncbi:MAG TPA: tetratricopeptide repeat protein [Sphingomonas sp.]